MEKIEYCKVLPHIFSQRDDMISEIWNQDVIFEKGHLYLVEADSGKGKSTFCSYILGYRHDFDGCIKFDELLTSSLKVADWVEIRKRHISYLFQELRLFPELTAYENVEIKNKLTGIKTRRQIEEWFERLGIADKLNAKVGHMSFGQQQRIFLAEFILTHEAVHFDIGYFRGLNRIAVCFRQAGFFDSGGWAFLVIVARGRYGQHGCGAARQ